MFTVSRAPNEKLTSGELTGKAYQKAQKVLTAKTPQNRPM
jgi:hypothetical protein